MKLFIILFIGLTKAYALTNSVSEERIFFDNVLFIKSDAPDANGDTAPGFCNATLLSANVAVTAAHCVHLAYVSKQHNIEIQKGSYKYKTQPDGTKRKIGYVPNFQKTINVEIEFSSKLKDKFDRSGYKAKIGPSEDVAIIWWKDNIAELAQLDYAEIISPAEEKLVKSKLKNFQLMPVTINPFSEMSLDTKRSSILNNYKWTISNYIESRSTTRVEEGDSGSPLFISLNQKLKVLALVKGKATTVFDNWDAYSPVTNSVCDIDTKMPTEFRIKNCLK
jgi:hypothetical protein